MSIELSLKRTWHPRAQRHGWRTELASLGAVAVLFITGFCSRADQVEMQNGDHYVGQVLSLNSEALVLQNDVLGTVKLPRGKVAHITFGLGTVGDPAARATRTNGPARAPLVTATNAAIASLPRLNTNASSLQQVREQFLSEASPEAKAKFNELAGGLLTGKLTVNDIRAEAKSAAEQLRALKADLGEDAGLAVDGYLAILDHFLNEGKSPSAVATNAPAKAPKSKAESPAKED